MRGMPKDANYEEARARKVAAEAEIAELELERIKGSLVQAHLVVNAWTDTLASMRAKLISLPSKAAPIVAAEDQAGVCQRVLDDLVREALEELSNYKPEVAPGESNSASEETKEETKAKEPPKVKRGRGRPKKDSTAK